MYCYAHVASDTYQRGRYCLFLLEGFYRSLIWRMSKDKVPRFVFINLGMLGTADSTNLYHIMDKETNFKQEVERIIRTEVGHGQTFDAHMIIDTIFAKNTELYMQYYSGKKPINTFHSQISKLIRTLEGELIEKEGKHVSKNIHGRNSSCTCWRRK